MQTLSPFDPQSELMKEKENTPSGSTPGQASERPAIYVCLTHGRVCSARTVSPECEITAYVPQADAESLEAQIVELREALENWHKDFGGGMLPFDNARSAALRQGHTEAESQRLGVHAVVDAIKARALSMDKADGEGE